MRRFRCWLAKRVIGPHGSIMRRMTEQEQVEYFRSQVQHEVDWLEEHRR